MSTIDMLRQSGGLKLERKREKKEIQIYQGKLKRRENLSFCSRSVETVGWIKGLRDLAGLQRTAFDPPLKRQGQHCSAALPMITNYNPYVNLKDEFKG